MTAPLTLCSTCGQDIPQGTGFCPSCGAAQQAGSSPALGLGERRQVTVLFADLASFTAASEHADPEDVIDMLNQVFTRLMAECDELGGYLDKVVGDQMMVLFGVPRAHEDDPVRAVRAALAMQAAMKELEPAIRETLGTSCSLHVGINTGPVVWGRVGPQGRAAPTVIGDVVNLASRLEHLAEGGQILVSEAVYLLSRRHFEFRALEPVRVKGKSALIPVFEPLGALRTAESHAGRRDRTLPPLLDRDRELAALQAHWSDALAGRPQIVLLSAEAGLGKSRLLAELADWLESGSPGTRPLVLHAYPASPSGNRYDPLARLLVQLFELSPDDPDLVHRQKVEATVQEAGITSSTALPLIGYLLGWYHGDARLAGAGQALDYLHESALEAAADILLRHSSRRPVALLIDDLHAATARTADWLNRLVAGWTAKGSRLADCRLMVVVASRPRGEAVARLVHVDTVLTLPPLSEFDRRELIAALLPTGGVPAALVERLSHESGGSPFYLVEVARWLVQTGQLVQQDGTWHLTRPLNHLEMPPSIEGLVMAALDDLDSDTRTVLHHAAVIGLRFPYRLLRAITPVAGLDTALLELERRGLIAREEEAGGEVAFTFARAAIRDVAYGSILRKTRRELHDRIARLIEEGEGAGDASLQSLAHHYAAGGNQEKMILYNWQVGQQALARYSFEEAHQHLLLAWDALMESEEADPAFHRRLAEALGDASTFTGNFAQAAACYQAAWKLVGDDSESLAWLYYKLGRLHFFQADEDAAGRYYQQASHMATGQPALVAQIAAEMRLLSDRA